MAESNEGNQQYWPVGVAIVWCVMMRCGGLIKTHNSG